PAAPGPHPARGRTRAATAPAVLRPPARRARARLASAPGADRLRRRPAAGPPPRRGRTRLPSAPAAARPPAPLAIVHRAQPVRIRSATAPAALRLLAPGARPRPAIGRGVLWPRGPRGPWQPVRRARIRRSSALAARQPR